MDSDKLQLSLINSVKIKNLINDSHFTQGQAGFVQNGSLAWIVRDSSLEILSAETGARIAHHNFGKHCSSRGSCSITSVVEVNYHPNVCLLAVATKFSGNGASAGVLSIFCVHGSKVLGSIDFCEKITSICYVHKSACEKSVLKYFKGTVALGTDQGKLFLIDLMIPSDVHEISLSPNFDADLFHCEHILADVDQTEILSDHKKVTARNQKSNEKSFFAIRLEVLSDTGAIMSMLCMPNLFILAVGLSDGRLVLYNLLNLNPFHLAYPPNDRSPLTHMSFVEPSDDPKCVVYVWTFHSSPNGAIAVMHSLMFSSKVDGICEDFKSCSVRLTMPIFVKNTVPVCCRSIMRTLSQDDEDVLTLNVLAWTSSNSNRTNIMVFDLNQWYKEEMPNVGDWRKPLKYVALFELQDSTALDVIVNEHSVFPFNSILRPEEHFYPNSLSFDVCVLENDKFSNYRWFGIQNIVLQQFNVIGPQIILEPSYYFNEFVKVAIIPQFTDVPYSMTTPLDLKREFLLSVALEYNFNGFLRKCASAWADGSYLGKDDTIGIGLSTLTDWIWNRAIAIKEVCNSLCKPLFDYSEQRIDYGTQKQLSQCCKQLKVLSDLFLIILKNFRQHIPDPIFVQLKSQSETITMAADYQEVLQWLLNVGLLPEGLYHPGHRDHQYEEEFLIVPYPYNVIRSNYDKQRVKLAGDFDGDSQGDMETSKFLFIDAFIEKECKSEQLREIWRGIYPPRSIQTLLRTLLIPDISVQSKHVIFVYLFMDINSVLSDSAYTSIVRNLIKFPAVFKMNPAMIKRTQAFWNLDNGNLDTAVEELISPLSHDKHLPLWQRELLIGALLKQNANNLALRALRCPGSQISSGLEMLTLLSNNLLSEALKIQRASGDRSLLEKLFEKILHSPNYEQLLDLTLTDEEGLVLASYLNQLKDSGLPNHVNIHFVFLLQRSKFLDAAHLVESLENDSTMNLEPPKQVLNAYFASMESTTRRLTTMVHREDVQVKESPLPLSVSLIRSRCNARNDIYQRTVQSISEAAYDNTNDKPFIGCPKLGIFEYKQPTVNTQDFSFAVEVNEHGKRKAIRKSDQVIRIEDFEAPRCKKQRLDNSACQRKSFMDMRVSCLTVFKETKPNFKFATKSATNSLRTTPDRVQTFGNFLNTPIVQKKTPPNQIPEKCPATPHSILKTRSNRGSLSPVPSRFSEFGDDKSVKSITFAALPDSRDISLNDSTMMEEESFTEQIESSVEHFYSPGKSPERPTTSFTQNSPEGPKPRKALSRSVTPVETSMKQVNETPAPDQETAATSQLSCTQQKSDEPRNAPELNDTISSTGSNLSEENNRPLHAVSVLGSDLGDFDSDSASDSSIPDKSIYGYVRRSVFPPNYGDITETWEDGKDEPAEGEGSEDSENVQDEQFEEVELPEHSDYDESNEKHDEFEYGDVDLDDSDNSSSSSRSAGKAKSTTEVICLDSSSEGKIVEDLPVTLPSFHNVGTNSAQINDFNEENDEPENVEMFSVIYDAELEENLIQQPEPEPEEAQIKIESPPLMTTLSRSASKESFASAEKSPDEPGGLQRKRSERIALKKATSVSEDDNDDAKSTISTRSTRSNKSSTKKKFSPSSRSKVTPDKTSPMEEMSESNRRLTRRQLQVVEKSRKLNEQIASGALRETRSDIPTRSDYIDGESDSESVRSESGSVSSKTSRKKKTPRKASKEDDSSSVTSKKSSKLRSVSPKLQQLSVIPEEKSPDEPGSLERKRSERIALKRAKSVTEDDNDDAKSTISTRSTRSNKSSAKKKTSPSSRSKITPDKTSPMEEMSESNRRLTRRQLQVIEKSRKLNEQIASGALRETRSDIPTRSDYIDGESDSESVRSESGSVSSKTSRKRKTPRKANKDDDSSSVTSKKSSKRLSASPKQLQLSVIPEETFETSQDPEPLRKKLKK